VVVKSIPSLHIFIKAVGLGYLFAIYRLANEKIDQN